ncbi:MAG: hypothetical protein KBF64_04960 [Anaerolineaceae bacterium]|nr:hypothetical protein [Anaerolineaceae bacterium]
MPFIGFLIVILTTVGTILFASKRVRAKYPPVFRKIAAIAKLRRAIGLSVEDGTRIHVTLGSANLTDPANTSAFVGLSSLHRLGQLSSTSDQPPVCTSGNGGLTLLSKDVLRAVSVETNTRELYDPDHGQLTGITPFSYAVGAMDILHEPGISANVLIGNFGTEAGFFSTISESNTDFTLAASDSITAQSIFFATTRDVLIGEELYAIPAYLAYSPIHLASLQVQDLLRWLVGIALIAGAILKLLGIL